MLKYAIVLILTLLLASCNNSENFYLTGNISGLKKGTLYLQRVDDTTLVNLDSLVVNGNAEFSLKTHLDEPQVLYLNLEKRDASDYDDRILFFAEPGEMTLTTSLKNFERQAAVTGSKNQLKLEEYNEMMMKFNNQNLDLIKKSFESQEQEANEDSIAFYDKKLENLVRRRYLYTVNFALNNKELEIAPYLAVSEIFDANVKYLDTIYKSLEPGIRKSKYGKTLKEFIKERQKSDKNPEQVEVAEEKEIPLEEENP